MAQKKGGLVRDGFSNRIFLYFKFRLDLIDEGVIWPTLLVDIHRHPDGRRKKKIRKEKRNGDKTSERQKNKTGGLVCPHI